MLLRRVHEVMGMPVTVHVADGDGSEAAVDAVFRDFELLDRTFSTFIGSSEVSRINRGELQPGGASGLLKEALGLSDRYEAATDRYFSAWIGGRLELSGIVKGWAIDRGCSILEQAGHRNYFIDAGGDLQARGHRENGSPWRVGIRHPVHRDKVVRVVLASDLAVATSGTYEKGDHIYDPHTGLPAYELLSLTVVGPDIVRTDVYATACFAMGMRGMAFIERTAGYEAYAIDRELMGTWTSGFDSLCAKREAV